VQGAWAVSRSKNSYLVAQYRRLAGRKLKNRTTYADLGGFFDRLEPERLTQYYVKRLETLGHKVTLESKVAA